MNAAIPTPLVARSRRQETADTVTLTLDASALPGGIPFRPGQFHMLYAFGVGEVPISISGDPTEPERVVHTLRAVGPVTTALAAVRRGMEIGVRGPFGNPWPIEVCEGLDIVIVAGGIGIAPLRSAILELTRQRERYARIILLYGARTPAERLYVKEVERWRAHGVDVQIVVDRGSDDWTGAVGVVPDLVKNASFDPLETVAFVCGPEVMIRFTLRALEARGVPPDRVFLSLERNMKCAIGICGRCQLGTEVLCRSGPIYSATLAGPLLDVHEL